LTPGVFVVVSGPPASGKTTLSRAIAPVLGLPLIAKDTIKQALMTVLPQRRGLDTDGPVPVDVGPLVGAIRAAAGRGLPGLLVWSAPCAPRTIAGWTLPAPLPSPPPT
jgi:hypothetical protein